MSFWNDYLSFSAVSEERLYFVVETKSSLFTDDRRDKEGAEIECGKAHFAALQVREGPPRYLVASSVTELLTSE